MRPGSAAPAPFGLRLHLAGILIAALLPALAAGGLALHTAAGAYRATFEARLRDTARALSLAVDADIRGRTQALTAFATSPAFGDGSRIADPAAAHAHAVRVAAASGMRIVVADRDGRFLLHHQVPPGMPLPDTGVAAEVLRAAIRQDQPVVSDLIAGPLVRYPVVAVVVPVPRTDGAPPLLAAGGSLDPGHFDAMLAAQQLEPGAFAGLVDAAGTVIARSDGRFRGTVLPPDLRAVLGGTGGIVRRTGLDGEDRLFANMALAAAPGWSVTVSVPHAVYRASWLEPLLGMAGGIGLALLASGGLALLLARRLLRPLGSLAAHARGVALDPERHRGTAAELPPVPVAELEALRQGFAAAEAALQRRVEAERRAYAALAEKETMLASAQQLTGVGGWTWEVAETAAEDAELTDPGAATLRWTEETCRIFGLAPGAPVDTAVFLEAVPPADRPQVRATLREALRSGRPYRIEHRIRRPDGTIRIVEELASPRPDANGRFRRVVGSCQDVTERRMTEAALADNAARLQDLLSTLDLAAAMARDVDGTIRFWSKGCELLYGWTAAEAMGRSAHQLLGTVFPVPLPEIEAVLLRDGEWLGELRQRCRDGDEVVVVARKALRRDAAGRAVAVAESVADVTALHAAREALAESEARLRSVVDSALDGIVVATEAGVIVSANLAAARMFGHPGPQALVGQDLGLLMPAGTAGRHGAWLSGLIRPEGAPEMAPGRTLTARRADGSEFPVEASVAGFAAGGRRLVTGILRDVSARVAAERALAESEARLRTIVETVPVGLIMAELPSGRILGANAHVGTLVRHPLPQSPDLGGDGGWVAFHADGSLVAGHEYPLARMVLAGEEAPSIEVHYQRGDGTRAWMRIMGRPVRDAEGRLVGGVVALVDVDGERRAREALAASEAEFRATFEQAAVGIAHVGLDGGWLRVNDRFCAIAGHRREDLLRLTFQDITHPDDLAADLAQGDALLAGRLGTYAMEKRYIRADGAVAWVNLTVSVLRDAAGRPDRFISVIEDIAARKAAEAALAASEERFRTLFERMEEGFALWEATRDEAGAIVDFRLLERNDAADRLTGRLPQACIGRTMRGLFPDMAPHVLDAYVRAAGTGEPQVLEAEEGRSIGRRLSIRIFSPGPERVAALVRDVTERVAAEAVVRDSEAMLRRVLDNLFAFVGVLAPDGTLLDANRAPLDAAGITLEEVRGRPFWEAYWWSYDPAVAAGVRAACRRAAAGEASRYDVEVRMAGDSRMAIDFQVAPLRDAAGRVTHLIPSAVDITERKRSEEAKMLLAREVDHRAKNALAVVQSVLTLTRTEDPAAFKKAVMGRIAAMALAHTLLARENWNGADLRALLAEELAAYRGGGGLEAAVQLDGPLVGLAPGAAQAVAMAIHELATNAAKYGALSRPGGHVSIAWSQEPATQGLVLIWHERGGPPLEAPPARRGFGTGLIQSTIVRQLQGRLQMDWDQTGLRCTLSLPARQVRWRARVAPRLG
ncbi:PAS domain S-box protein [Dankookia rubra]|uniref:histidine kinase n=1 Tax=Dankookia rubra TaxID=1442381 RepID=A0A4R5QE32_9PROT|nr:PAS domain S-box protein [Dankookia rubra]TDH60919.1 PAS domain S-box protein [Dankookia rubra]